MNPLRAAVFSPYPTPTLTPARRPLLEDGVDVPHQLVVERLGLGAGDVIPGEPLGVPADLQELAAVGQLYLAVQAPHLPLDEIPGRGADVAGKQPLEAVRDGVAVHGDDARGQELRQHQEHLAHGQADEVGQGVDVAAAVNQQENLPLGGFAVVEGGLYLAHGAGGGEAVAHLAAELLPFPGAADGLEEHLLPVAAAFLLGVYLEVGVELEAARVPAEGGVDGRLTLELARNAVDDGARAETEQPPAP